MKTTNTTNSIINVTINGLTAMDTVEKVKTRLEAMDPSLFNIALLCAYGTGTTIPAYIDNKGNEHGEATVEKPISRNDYIELVGRDKSTMSKWINTIKTIIEKGYFNDFAMGKYPFQYEKLIVIFDEKNEEFFKGYLLSDLLKLSQKTLVAMLAVTETNATEETVEVAEENATEEVIEVEVAEEVELTTITYNNVEYTVPKKAFEKWLSDNAITE